MAGMSEFAFSTKMRDTIVKLIEETVGKQRPIDRYGIVQSIDLPNRRCSVLMNGDPDPVFVSMGALIPEASGVTVRVSGTINDRYVADVFGSVALQYSTLRPTSVTEATLASTDNALQIGPTSGANLVFDTNELQARNNGAVQSLFLNPHGGTVWVGGVIGDTLGVGDTAGGNIFINGNQIRSRTGTTEDGHLFFNYASATTTPRVYIGKAGNLSVGSSGSDLGGGATGSDQVNTAAGYLRLNWETSNPVAIGGAGTTTLVRAGLQIGGALTGVTTAAVSSSATVNGMTLNGNVTTAGGSQLGTVLILASTDVNVTGAPANTAGTAANWVNTAGSNWRITRNTSSRRYKEFIQDLESFTPEQILELRPRTFKRNDQTRDVDVSVDTLDTGEDEGMLNLEDMYRTELIPVEESPWFAGFIAEEADEIGLTTFVVRNSEGEVESFQYDQFAAVAHQIVLRAQQKKIEELESKLASFEARLAALEAA